MDLLFALDSSRHFICSYSLKSGAMSIGVTDSILLGVRTRFTFVICWKYHCLASSRLYEGYVPKVISYLAVMYRQFLVITPDGLRRATKYRPVRPLPRRSLFSCSCLQEHRSVEVYCHNPVFIAYPKCTKAPVRF